MKFENTLAFARKLDEEDPLRKFRAKFFLPQYNGMDKMYFSGNSTGPAPRNTKEYLLQELEDWNVMGSEGHFEARKPWYPYHELFPKLLSPIIGCLPEEVVVMNSLSVNIHLLFVSFYRPTKERYKIICEAKAFPSDQYALETQVRHHGFDPADAIIEVKPRQGEHTIRKEDILDTIKRNGESVAVVYFSGINYYTGQTFPMKEITAAAHAIGAYAGFDLAHAAGNIKLHMHDWDVDFACWCTYKYLNSGPGAVGGVYIHQKHAQNKNMPRFAGWWGYDKKTRFMMEKGFDPIPTAEGWQLSNAPVFSMAVHKAALDIFEEAGMDAIIAKSSLLGRYLIYILDSINIELTENRIQIITSRDESERGCQISMVINKNGRKVFDYLMQNGVSAGWREPEVLRVAPAPLFNSFEDLWRFGQVLITALKMPA